jgi:predicted HTH transcriptional regulator
MWVDVDGIREREHLHERTLPTLFDATIGLRVRNSSHRANVEAFEDAEISHPVATSDLRTLVKLGLLEKKGEKRGTYYVAGEQLRDIRSRVQGNREPIDASALFVT